MKLVPGAKKVGDRCFNQLSYLARVKLMFKRCCGGYNVALKISLIRLLRLDSFESLLKVLNVQDLLWTELRLFPALCEL